MGINVPGMPSIGSSGSGSTAVTVDGITDAGTTGKNVLKAGTQAAAQTALGLGSAATKTVGTASGNVMPVGAFGVGSTATTKLADCNASIPGGFYYGFGKGAASPTLNCPPEAGNSTLTFFVASGNTVTHLICLENTPSGVNAWFGERYSDQIKWNRIYTTLNTTVDANGFIKRASPIARVCGAPESMGEDFLSDGFNLAGFGAVNGEATGVRVERVSIGVYKITGALGLAAEGWTIEIPHDVNGNRLCFVATEVAEGGTITVKVSKRRFDADTATIVAGEPMDIPDGRWLDLRLQVPESVGALPIKESEGHSK